MNTACKLLSFQGKADWCNHILAVLTLWSNLCQSNICGVGGDTAVVVLHRHEDVAVVTPVGGPGVLYQPVRLPIEVAVAHRQHGVVQVLNRAAWKNRNASRGWRSGKSYRQNEIKLTTGRFVVDAVAVENKWAVRSVDAHGHRPVLKERQLQRQRISWCYVGVTLDLCGKLRRVNVAKAVLVKSETGEGRKEQKASAEKAKTWQENSKRADGKPNDDVSPFIRSPLGPVAGRSYKIFQM